MKPTKENMNIMLNAAYFEGKRAELSGQQLELPSNVPAFFDAVEEKATGLPAEFSDYEYGLKRHSEWGLSAYEKGDDAQLRKRIWIILQNLARLERDLIEYNRERGAKKGGKAPKRQKWAEQLAEHLVAQGMKFPEAWASIPDEWASPLSLDEDTVVSRVHVDEVEKLVAHDAVSGGSIGNPQSLSNFRDRYFYPAKRKSRQ
tara:strand:- start:51 stop:656 length:606 start_codon:yes stop_codon:yes gene_type:complete